MFVAGKARVISRSLGSTLHPEGEYDIVYAGLNQNKTCLTLTISGEDVRGEEFSLQLFRVPEHESPSPSSELWRNRYDLFEVEGVCTQQTFQQWYTESQEALERELIARASRRAS